MSDPSSTTEPSSAPTAVSGVGVCRSCPAPIVWIVSAKSGKPIPCDPEEIEVIPGSIGCRPTAPGNVVHAQGVAEDGRVVSGLRADCPAGREVLATLLGMGVSTVKIRISHFATCPNARSHRRGR